MSKEHKKMKSMVTFDYSAAKGFISDSEITMMERIAENAKAELVKKAGPGNEFLGWIDLPIDYDKEEFARIQTAAKKIQNDSEVLLKANEAAKSLTQQEVEQLLESNPSLADRIINYDMGTL